MAAGWKGSRTIDIGSVKLPRCATTVLISWQVSSLELNWLIMAHESCVISSDH
jgi:hypothetical protein